MTDELATFIHKNAIENETLFSLRLTIFMVKTVLQDILN